MEEFERRAGLDDLPLIFSGDLVIGFACSCKRASAMAALCAKLASTSDLVALQGNREVCTFVFAIQDADVLGP